MGDQPANERTYDRLADLSVRVADWSLDPRERETAGGTVRRTTVFAVEGGGHVGRGEDVTYDADLHDVLVDHPPALDLAGERTLAEASAALESIDLFPAEAPARETYRHYRRWAVESALLDLALKQAGTDLGGVLDRQPEPVRFCVSTGLGDPASVEPVTRWLAVDPTLEFKVDVTRRLPPDVLEALIATESVQVVDLKAQYAATAEYDGDEPPSWVGKPDPDPAFYRELLQAFPEAVFEDPAVTDTTRPVLEPATDRLSWDAPVHSTAELETQPLAVGWCNVKPSRFGSLERLFDFLDFARRTGLQLYGGGQYELSIGRGQLHELAALFYPDGPNDIAPRAYNDPEPRVDLPSSPMAVPEPEPGYGWASAG